MIRLALGLSLLGPALAFAGTPLSCDLGAPGTPRVVEVLRTDAIANSHVYHLREGTASRRLLFDGEAEDSRGSEVRIRCAGRTRRALVVMGDFMSAGYPRGMVMVHDAAGQRFQRFDFAERNAPHWLYLGKTETLLVFPPGGRLETAHRYLIQRFVDGDKPGGLEAIDSVRPNARGYEVIELGR